MDKFQMLSWIKRFHRQNKIDVPFQKVEDAIESATQRIKAIDPDTNGQWQRMNIVLKRKHYLSGNQEAAVERVKFRLAISYAIALVVFVIIGVIAMRQYLPKIYETTKGQHSTITLQDSTEITLNYLSELSVNRSVFDKARRVSLKGEALFHVRKNGAPFIIITDIGIVQVLGTQFNVRVRDEKMEVAVLSGSVRLSVFKDGKDSSIILTGGQISQCTKNNYPGLPASLPFSDYPGWLQGKITTYRSSLESVCRELESQLDIKIKIENPQLNAATITGTINGQNPQNALTTLVQLTGSKFRYEAGGYIIY